MKNKKNIIILILVIVLGVLLFYKLIGSENIKIKTREYLKTQNCSKDSIKSIKVSHSYLNAILSYDEWTILVEFTKEPDVLYEFNYRNKKVEFESVRDSQNSKDYILELNEKFTSGELCE